MDHHQGVTVAITCATWVVAVCPGLPILYKTLENPRRPTEALFVAGNALLLTSIAGLVAVTALSAHVTKGSPHELPDEPDWVDVVDAGTGDD